MGIIDKAMQEERDPAAEAAKMESPQQEAAEGGVEQPEPAAASARISDPDEFSLALQGALFDDRTRLAERIIAAAVKARDPAMTIADSALDVVLSVAEKTGFDVDAREALPIAMMVLGQLTEMAEAAKIDVSREQVVAAAKHFVQQFQQQEQQQ